MVLTLPDEWIAQLPTDRPVTADDVLQLPEGPPHVELIAGEVVVSPSPIPVHARVAQNLFRALDAACPPHLELFGNPLDWVIDDRHVLAPDVLVVPRSNVGPKRLDGPPVLVVEVLSPSDRAHEIAAKEAACGRGGADHYWIVDPEGPLLRILRRRPDHTWAIVAELACRGTYRTDDPYAITVDVAGLVR